MEIGRIFFKENVVYGADAYGCNKFKIFNDVAPVAWDCIIGAEVFDVGCLLFDSNSDLSDEELEAATSFDFFIDGAELSFFLDKWIKYFGGLDLE